MRKVQVKDPRHVEEAYNPGWYGKLNNFILKYIHTRCYTKLQQ
jgi:hypothetical protein